MNHRTVVLAIAMAMVSATCAEAKVFGTTRANHSPAWERTKQQVVQNWNDGRADGAAAMQWWYRSSMSRQQHEQQLEIERRRHNNQVELLREIFRLESQRKFR